MCIGVGAGGGSAVAAAAAASMQRKSSFMARKPSLSLGTAANMIFFGYGK
jgi:hypothetical protein